jgi:RNA polymerase sigma-70 factor (ECF subfamily)
MNRDSETSQGGDLTALLRRFAQGDRDAGESAMRIVDHELRKIAARYLRYERKGQTLQTTALVNEAHLRLIGAAGIEWNDRNHYFAVASRVMRNVLVEHARSNKALKRAGVMFALETNDIAEEALSPEVLDVDLALDDLAATAPRQAQLVELRFFGGLSLDECAGVLGMSPRTADKDWALARAWLRRRLMPRAHGSGI